MMSSLTGNLLSGLLLGDLLRYLEGAEAAAASNDIELLYYRMLHLSGHYNTQLVRVCARVKVGFWVCWRCGCGEGWSGRGVGGADKVGGWWVAELCGSVRQCTAGAGLYCTIPNSPLHPPCLGCGRVCWVHWLWTNTRQLPTFHGSGAWGRGRLLAWSGVCGWSGTLSGRACSLWCQPHPKRIHPCSLCAAPTVWSAGRRSPPLLPSWFLSCTETQRGGRRSWQSGW